MAMAEQDEEELKPIAVETQVAETGKWAKTLTVTVPAAAVTKEFEAITSEWAVKVRLPGFRAGKVPRNLIEKRFGEDIRKQALANIVPRALQSAILQEKLDTVGEPKMDLEKLSARKGEPLSFTAEVEVRPGLELSNYKGLLVEQEEVEVLPEEIEEMLLAAREQFATMIDAPPDHALGDQDVVQSSLRFTVDGTEIQKEEDASLFVMAGHVIGACANIEVKFLAGVKAGDKRSLEAELNESFPRAEYHGKKATIDFEIKSIRQRILPPLDDALAQKMGLKTWTK